MRRHTRSRKKRSWLTTEIRQVVAAIADAQLDAARDGAGARLEQAEERLHERGLAAAVRPDDTDALAAVDGAVEIAHHRLRPRIADGDALGAQRFLAALV